MPKPKPRPLKGPAELNAAEIELAANPLRETTFVYNDVEWWLAWRPNKIQADAIEEIEHLRLQRLVGVGIPVEEMQRQDSDWRQKLTDEQTAKLLSVDKGLRAYEVRAYVPAIEDWNLPDDMGRGVDDFLSSGGIYDAALKAVMEAFSPTSAGATEDAATTATPSSPAGATPSTADATASPTADSATSRAGRLTSNSPKNTAPEIVAST